MKQNTNLTASSPLTQSTNLSNTPNRSAIFRRQTISGKSKRESISTIPVEELKEELELQEKIANIIGAIAIE